MGDSNSTHESREAEHPLNGGGDVNHVATANHDAFVAAARQLGIQEGELAHLADPRIAAKVVKLLRKERARVPSVSVDDTEFGVLVQSWTEMLTGRMAFERMFAEGYEGDEQAFRAWIARRKPTIGTYVCVVREGDDNRTYRSFKYDAAFQSMNTPKPHPHGESFTDSVTYVAFQKR